MTPARSADANSLETSVKKYLGEVRAAYPALLREARSLFTGGGFGVAQENRTDFAYKGWETFDLLAFDFVHKKKSFAVETLTLEIETISDWFERSKLAE